MGAAAAYEASRDVPTSPAAACAAILAPAALPRWFRGARVLRADDAWPARGASMSWAVGSGERWRFDARVAEAALPSRVVLDVHTPSGRSRVTFAFDALPGGGTRFTKRVEVLESKGALAALFLRAFLRGAVRREVAKAAALAGASG